MTTYQTLIVADGKLPDYFVWENIRYEKLICTDGAALQLQKINVCPDIILGDLDTLLQKFKTIENIQVEFPNSEIIHQPDQECTDLEKAFTYNEQFSKTSLCLGLFDNAFDHTLHNLMLFAKYAAQQNLTFLHSDKGQPQWGIYLTQNCCIRTQNNSKISFIPLPEAKIQAEQLKWPLNGEKYRFLDSHSIRNETTSDKLMLKIQGQVLLVLTSKDCPKCEYTI